MNTETPEQRPAWSLGLMPRLPSIAGFWPRLFALIVDLVFLHFLARFAEKAFGDALFRDDRLVPWISVAVFYFYFVSLDGPMGRGQTIGKLLMKLRVTDLDGRPPGWTPAAIRALLLFPYVLLSAALGEFMRKQGIDSVPGWLYGMLSIWLGLTLSFAHAITIAFNPFKQGLHDHLAGTVVRRAEEEPLTFEGMKNHLGIGWRRSYKQPFISGAISFALLLVGVTFLTTNRQAPSMREFWAEKEKLPLEGPLKGATSVFPNLVDRRTLDTMRPAASAESPPADSGQPKFFFQLTRRELWQTPAQAPELRAAALAHTDEYLRLLERHPLFRDNYEGPVDIEVSLLSHAEMLLHTAIRVHAVFETTGTVKLKGAATAP